MTGSKPAGTDAGSQAVIFNGRFLSAGSTGVNRVAREMVQALDRIMAAEPTDAPASIIAAPANAQAAQDLSRIATQTAGRLTGQLWEQISLPGFVGRRRLVNLCNTGPVIRPDIVMMHDAQIYLSPESYSKPFRLYYRLLQPLLGARARHILTVSDFSRAMLVKYGVAPAEKITVIHNGVDHVLRVAADSTVVDRLALTPNRYVVALANTQKHKNIALLLRAFADPRLKEAKLVLIGGQADAFTAGGQVMPPNVVFAGRVSDGELRGLLEGAACLAFPSRTEGFGLPPLEAMIVGCPAVVAPCGALPEVCGSAVVYAGPDDLDAWVVAMAAFVQDGDLRRTKGQEGRIWASAFTWERSARRLLALLQGPSGL